MNKQARSYRAIILSVLDILLLLYRIGMYQDTR